MSLVAITVNEEPRFDRLAEQLRELADLCEKGDVISVVVVSDHKATDTLEPHYLYISEFADAWTVLGALEYAKAKVLRGVLESSAVKEPK